jgi:hypothetical protein
VKKSVLEVYLEKVQSGELAKDDHQESIVKHLDALNKKVEKYEPPDKAGFFTKVCNRMYCRVKSKTKMEAHVTKLRLTKLVPINFPIWCYQNVLLCYQKVFLPKRFFHFCKIKI